MARFITTTEISYLTEDAIRNGKQCVLIVTPYLKVPTRFREIIEERDKSGDVRIVFVCRPFDSKSSEKRWLESLTDTGIVYLENVHAKCVLTPDRAIVSSLNLYEYSMVNNIEFGFVADKGTDLENYLLVRTECLRLLKDKWVLSSRQKIGKGKEGYDIVRISNAGGLSMGLKPSDFAIEL